MRQSRWLLTIAVLVMLPLVAMACSQSSADDQEPVGEQEADQNVLTVAELMANPLYDTPIVVQGEVGALGEEMGDFFDIDIGL